MKQILSALLLAVSASAVWAADSSVYIRNVCDSLKWSEDPVMHLVFESAEETDWVGKFASAPSGVQTKTVYGEEFFSSATLAYWKSPYKVPYALDAPCSDPAQNTYQYQTYSSKRNAWTLDSATVYSRIIDTNVDTLKGFETAYNWIAFPEEYWNSTVKAFSSEELLVSRTLDVHASTFHAYAVYFDTSLTVSGADSVWTIQYYTAQTLDLDSSSAFDTVLSTLKNSLPQTVSASGDVRVRVFKFTLQNRKDIVLAEESSSSESPVSSASAESSSSPGASSSAGLVVASSSSANLSSSSLESSSSAGKSSASVQSSSSVAGTLSSSGESSTSSAESASSASRGSSDSGSLEESSSSSSETEGVVARKSFEGTFLLEGRNLRISVSGSSPVTVEIYDVMGNRLRRYSVESRGESVLPLGNLPNGTYLAVVSGEKSFARRFQLR